MLSHILGHLFAVPFIANWLIARAQRTPYSDIITDGVTYMRRFWLFNPYLLEGRADTRSWLMRHLFSVRVHHILLPDLGRHLHDHPWNARTFILRGHYGEIRQIVPGRCAYFFRCEGDTARLKFGEFHRISTVAPDGAWTLFVTGQYQGTWGFPVDGAKMQWRTYLASRHQHAKKGEPRAAGMSSSFAAPYGLMKGLQSVDSATVPTMPEDGHAD